MENKLTNEEIARVFAMYLGCEVTPVPWSCGGYTGLHREVKHDNLNILLLHEECRISITPLSKITDEDAIQVASFVYTDKIGTHELIQIGNDYVSYNFCGGKLSSYSSQRLKQFSCVEDVQIFQYLILKGYAVPLFFAPNHWANGKTAIELGISIEK